MFQYPCFLMNLQIGVFFSLVFFSLWQLFAGFISVYHVLIMGQPFFSAVISFFHDLSIALLIFSSLHTTYFKRGTIKCVLSFHTYLFSSLFTCYTLLKGKAFCNKNTYGKCAFHSPIWNSIAKCVCDGKKLCRVDFRSAFWFLNTI